MFLLPPQNSINIFDSLLSQYASVNLTSHYHFSKVNPADCVDMDCDGLKKNLLKDIDGTFLDLGTPSVVFSESEFEWDGDARRGLGDYRIPKTMLTAVNGSRIDPAPKKGK